jgi:hypothetical protein
MKVKELIELLKNCNQNANVLYEVADPNSGCESCGYNETYNEIDVAAVNDLETRVILSAKD